jgi:hypothetical protein
MVKELKMKLNELIEIESSIRALRDGVLNDYDSMAKFKKEILEASRCIGMLSYAITKYTKEIEVEIDTL